MSEMLQNLSEIAPKAVEWAWEGFIPRGKVTLLTGGPGAGKSFVASQVAAMVTRGVTTPIQQGNVAAGNSKSVTTSRTRPRGVVILSAEDAADDTVLPRLRAAKADVSQVFVLRVDDMGVIGTEDGVFSLSRDLIKLEGSLQELSDAGTEVGLIVIDPIDRYFSPLDKKQDRIEVVARLTELAATYGAAILVIANSSMKAGSRGGTVVYQELMNSARSVLMVAQDLDVKDQRLLLPVKLNLSAMRPGLAFTIVDGVIQWREEPISLTGEDYQHQAHQASKTPLMHEELSETQRVIKWLKEELTPGRATSLWVQKRAAKVDIAYGTLRRAFKYLGCRATKVKNQWFWNLPGHPESASPDLLEQPLETPEGETLFRESIPHWLAQENAEESKKQGAQTSPMPR